MNEIEQQNITINDANLIKILQQYEGLDGSKTIQQIQKLLDDNGTTLDFQKDFQFTKSAPPKVQLKQAIQQLQQKDREKKPIQEEEEEKSQSTAAETIKKQPGRPKGYTKQPNKKEFNVDLEQINDQSELLNNQEQLEKENLQLKDFLNIQLKYLYPLINKQQKLERAIDIGQNYQKSQLKNSFDKYKQITEQQIDQEYRIEHAVNIIKQSQSEIKQQKQEQQQKDFQQNLEKQQIINNKQSIIDIYKQLKQQKQQQEQNELKANQNRSKSVFESLKQNRINNIKDNIANQLMEDKLLDIQQIKKLDKDLQYKLFQLTDVQLQEFNKNVDNQQFANKIHQMAIEKKITNWGQGFDMIENIIDSYLDPLVQKNNTQTQQVKLLQGKPIKSEIAYKQPYFAINPRSSFKIRQIC